MIGNLFLLINSLRPKIKASIFKESFNVQIESNELKKELDKVREVRNRIAHAEQLFFTKNSYLQTNKLNKTNYPIALKVNIKESFLNKILEPLVTFIDKYIRIFEKYKNN